VTWSLAISYLLHSAQRGFSACCQRYGPFKPDYLTGGLSEFENPISQHTIIFTSELLLDFVPNFYGFHFSFLPVYGLSPANEPSRGQRLSTCLDYILRHAFWHSIRRWGVGIGNGSNNLEPTPVSKRLPDMIRRGVIIGIHSLDMYIRSLNTTKYITTVISHCSPTSPRYACHAGLVLANIPHRRFVGGFELRLHRVIIDPRRLRGLTSCVETTITFFNFRQDLFDVLHFSFLPVFLCVWIQ
jgi:hypothetical protein